MSLSSPGPECKQRKLAPFKIIADSGSEVYHARFQRTRELRLLSSLLSSTRIMCFSEAQKAGFVLASTTRLASKPGRSQHVAFQIGQLE